MRKYIRHPADIPIEYHFGSSQKSIPHNVQNISAGGLCFESKTPIAQGTQLTINMTDLRHPFSVVCVVAWTRKKNNVYEIGVKFIDEKTAFRMRMIEQVFYIEEYRKSISRKQKHEVSWKEASSEWISKHAADFPGNEN